MITDRVSAREVTRDDILHLIESRALEENALEFKEINDTDVLKAACAIANFGGGFILIGVKENGVIRRAAPYIYPTFRA